MKTKVIIVIDHLGIGGAQQQVLEYLKFANRNLYDIKIVNLDETYNLLGDKISDLGYKVFNFRHKGFFNARTLIEMIRLFKKEKPHIVHTYLFTADCYGRLAAKIAGVRNIICSIRDRNLWMKPHHIFADRILSRFTDMITANAEPLRTFLIRERKVNSDKIITIHNGIDIKRFEYLSHPQELRKDLGIPSDGLVVGMVARFSSQKDYETFFAAAGKVSAVMKNVYFLAIGDGKKKAEFEQYVKKEGIPNIIFTGVRKDVIDLINMMNVGVLSTYYEGCPNVILEYMACSKPVVATNVDGCQELIIDNETGFLVPVSDSQFMADKLIQLLNNRELIMRMGQAGYKRVTEYFTSQKLVKNTENLYQQLLKPKVAFIVSSFPRYSEIFISRELNQLKVSGLHFYIYSLRAPQDKVIHNEVKDLMTQACYLPFISFKVLLINLYFILRHPLRYFTTFIKVFLGNIRNPDFLCKTTVAWPKTVGFAWLAKREKISHIHGQWATYPATMALIISRLIKVPFSFTGHAHDIYVDTTMLVEKIRQAKFVLTCTAYNKNYLLGLLNGHKAQASSHILEDKIIVNYHGVDIEKFNGSSRKLQVSSRKPFQILSVGSLLECKGFDVLIEACRLLKDKGIDFECTVAGGGPLEKSLKSQAARHKLDEKIKFTGYITQEELIPLYQQADVFALPVRLDIHWGIPNVLLEAMAAKVPVICTNLPSIPELIGDDKRGLIIPEINPEVLAEALVKLYRDSELREEIAKAGYRVIEEKFDLKKNIAKLTGVFTN